MVSLAGAAEVLLCWGLLPPVKAFQRELMAKKSTAPLGRQEKERNRERKEKAGKGKGGR